MDNQIRVALVGCNGRMGKMLIEAVANNPASDSMGRISRHLVVKPPSPSDTFALFITAQGSLKASIKLMATSSND